MPDFFNDNRDQDDVSYRRPTYNDMHSSNNYHYYRKKAKLPFFTIVFISLISAIVGGLVTAFFIPSYIQGKNLDFPNVITENPKIEIVPKSEDITVAAAVAKKAMPSVVGITTVSIQRDFFFGAREAEGVGTGVIVDSRGYILTNSHVVNDGQAKEVRVLLDNSETITAQVLWNDSVLDLAVVKVNATDLPVAELGNSDELVVGETAIAIGNPLGLSFERTVTSGIISGLNRSIPITQYDSIEGLIQTDASINPGNSGGPLLNSKGEVIGINTAKIQTGEGLGFAIPINIAKPIVDEFINQGEFSKVYLGIRGIDAIDYIQNYGDDLGVDEGVLIFQITPDSPAHLGGLQEKDVIISLDNHKITNMRQLQRELYGYRPGDSAVIGVVRNKERIDIQINFGSSTLQ